MCAAHPSPILDMIRLCLVPVPPTSLPSSYCILIIFLMDKIWWFFFSFGYKILSVSLLNFYKGSLLKTSPGICEDPFGDTLHPDSTPSIMWAFLGIWFVCFNVHIHYIIVNWFMPCAVTDNYCDYILMCLRWINLSIYLSITLSWTQFLNWFIISKMTSSLLFRGNSL